jgi:hypothetical protein
MLENGGLFLALHLAAVGGTFKLVTVEDTWQTCAVLIIASALHRLQAMGQAADCEKVTQLIGSPTDYEARPRNSEQVTQIRSAGDEARPSEYEQVTQLVGSATGDEARPRDCEQVTQLIGSVSALDRGPGGMISQGSGSGFLHSNEAVELNVVERGQGIGLCLDVSSQIQQPHAYLQVGLSQPQKLNVFPVWGRLLSDPTASRLPPGRPLSAVKSKFVTCLGSTPPKFNSLTPTCRSASFSRKT